jgi:DNA (cytosine-5)-methyltransferase 1
MRFGSVCSGIEAASVAWPFWEAAWFSEIEPFPCAVLKHHYPDVPNHGDMTALPERILSGEVEAPDVFCGGTPCQAFSVAGNRKSLDDARGNLSLTFCEIADAIDSVRYVRNEQPTIIFWENVPGVLNTPDNAFGCFLGKLAGEHCELQPSGGRWTDAGVVHGPKRTIAWRVLDAQYFGLAQRRKRVFVVASSRKGFNPSEILLEFQGERRDTAPSREARKKITADSEGGVIGNRMTAFGEYVADETASTIKMRDYKDATDLICAEVSPPHAFKIRGGCEGGGKGYLGQDEQAFTITCGHDQQVAVPIAFTTEQTPKFNFNQSLTLTQSEHKHNQCVATEYAVRRLTPIECERLQGFPDNYTNIPWRNKPEAPDGPRYKALGNSWAVPVVRWIGERVNFQILS